MMSRVLEWAWGQDLTPQDKLALVWLANHSDGRYVRMPPPEQAVAQLGLGKAAMGTSFDSLKRQALVAFRGGNQVELLLP